MHKNLLLVVCMLAPLMWAQSANENPKQTSQTVKGSGCVEAGVEGGCLIVHDLKSGTTFNVFFKDKAPKIDTAIEFEGTENDNPNMCMQGRAVDVKTWNPIRLHCPQHSPHQSGKAIAPNSLEKCGEWYAWYNTQPTGPKSIHVAGMCTFPTSGYSVKLVPHVPAGFNPQIYLFDLVITRPTGKVSFIIRHVPMNYSENTDKLYESVQIEPDHVTVPVKVIQ
jgi:hypothetical protein